VYGQTATSVSQRIPPTVDGTDLWNCSPFSDNASHIRTTWSGDWTYKRSILWIRNSEGAKVLRRTFRHRSHYRDQKTQRKDTVSGVVERISEQIQLLGRQTRVTMSRFYMTLASNNSMDYYPQDTVVQYSTKLNGQIKLDGEWEVGLTEISFSFNVDNVLEGNAILSSTILDKMQ